VFPGILTEVSEVALAPADAAAATRAPPSADVDVRAPTAQGGPLSSACIDMAPTSAGPEEPVPAAVIGSPWAAGAAPRHGCARGGKSNLASDEEPLVEDGVAADVSVDVDVAVDVAVGDGEGVGIGVGAGAGGGVGAGFDEAS
jgi:hypothetical protein